jgi:hypothetical protein
MHKLIKIVAVAGTLLSSAVCAEPQIRAETHNTGGGESVTTIYWSWPDDGADRALPTLPTSAYYYFGPIFSWWSDSVGSRSWAVGDRVPSSNSVLHTRPAWVSAYGTSGSYIIQWKPGVGFPAASRHPRACWSSGYKDKYKNDLVFPIYPYPCEDVPQPAVSCDSPSDVLHEFGSIPLAEFAGATSTVHRTMRCTGAVSTTLTLDRDYVRLGPTGRATLAVNGKNLSTRAVELPIAADVTRLSFTATLSGVPEPGSYEESAVLLVSAH